MGTGNQLVEVMVDLIEVDFLVSLNINIFTTVETNWFWLIFRRIRFWR